VSSDPDDGTVNVHPSARPWQLPRIRRGMNRPASTSLQAGKSGESPAVEKCGQSGLSTWLSLDDSLICFCFSNVEM